MKTDKYQLTSKEFQDLKRRMAEINDILSHAVITDKPNTDNADRGDSSAVVRPEYKLKSCYPALASDPITGFVVRDLYGPQVMEHHTGVYFLPGAKNYVAPELSNCFTLSYILDAKETIIRDPNFKGVSPAALLMWQIRPGYNIPELYSVKNGIYATPDGDTTIGAVIYRDKLTDGFIKSTPMCIGNLQRTLSDSFDGFLYLIRKSDQFRAAIKPVISYSR